MQQRSTTLKYLIIGLKGLGLIAAIYLVFRLFLLSLVLLAPFIVAVLVSVSVERPVKFLERKVRLKRSTASLIMVVFVLTVFAVVVALIAGRIATELADLVTKLPYIQGLFTDRSEGVIAFLSDYTRLFPFDLITALNDTASQVLGKLAGFLPAILIAMLGLLALVPQALFFLIVATVAAFFISRDLDSWRQKVVVFLPSGSIEPALKILSKLIHALFGWFKTQLIIMTATAVFTIIGLSIMRVDYVVLVGVIVGIVDALPVLGPSAVFLPWATFALLTGNPLFALGLVILWGVVAVSRNIIEPLVLPDQVGLEPIPTLVSMYVGLRLIGFMGLAVGPIVLVVFTALQEAGVVGKIKVWLMSSTNL